MGLKLKGYKAFYTTFTKETVHSKGWTVSFVDVDKQIVACDFARLNVYGILQKIARIVQYQGTEIYFQDNLHSRHDVPAGALRQHPG